MLNREYFECQKEESHRNEKECNLTKIKFGNYSETIFDYKTRNSMDYSISILQVMWNYEIQIWWSVLGMMSLEILMYW